jgi:death-on-curing family protein
MAWIPTIEYIITLFESQISSGNLMNRGGLESTLDKIKWGIPYHGMPTIWNQTTILYKELIENHYFSDGNKRIAVLIAYIFLSKNNISFSPPQGEIYSFTVEVAQGHKTYEQIKQWFQQYSQKI